ncbi:MAG: hypothetical protein WED07_01100 [Candidatus Freyarchaeum deiterrae]
MLTIPVSLEIKTQQRKQVATTITMDLYNMITSKIGIYGSLAAYIRYLILRDNDQNYNANLSMVTTYRQTTLEITQTKFMNPPRNTSDDKNANNCNPNFAGYGDLHQQLILELKSKIRKID